LKDLFEKVLCKDPKQRIKLNEFKMHPWVDPEGKNKIDEELEKTDKISQEKLTYTALQTKLISMRNKQVKGKTMISTQTEYLRKNSPRDEPTAEPEGGIDLFSFLKETRVPTPEVTPTLRPEIKDPQKKDDPKLYKNKNQKSNSIVSEDGSTTQGIFSYLKGKIKGNTPTETSILKKVDEESEEEEEKKEEIQETGKVDNPFRYNQFLSDDFTETFEEDDSGEVDYLTELPEFDQTIGSGTHSPLNALSRQNSIFVLTNDTETIEDQIEFLNFLKTSPKNSFRNSSFKKKDKSIEITVEPEFEKKDEEKKTEKLKKFQEKKDLEKREKEQLELKEKERLEQEKKKEEELDWIAFLRETPIPPSQKPTHQRSASNPITQSAIDRTSQSSVSSQSSQGNEKLSTPLQNALIKKIISPRGSTIKNRKSEEEVIDSKEMPPPTMTTKEFKETTQAKVLNFDGVEKSKTTPRTLETADYFFKATPTKSSKPPSDTSEHSPFVKILSLFKKSGADESKKSSGDLKPKKSFETILLSQDVAKVKPSSDGHSPTMELKALNRKSISENQIATLKALNNTLNHIHDDLSSSGSEGGVEEFVVDDFE
jgi:hypothetical protein